MHRARAGGRDGEQCHEAARRTRRPRCGRSGCKTASLRRRAALSGCKDSCGGARAARRGPRWHTRSCSSPFGRGEGAARHAAAGDGRASSRPTSQRSRLSSWSCWSSCVRVPRACSACESAGRHRTRHRIAAPSTWPQRKRRTSCKACARLHVYVCQPRPQRRTTAHAPAHRTSKRRVHKPASASARPNLGTTRASGAACAVMLPNAHAADPPSATTTGRCPNSPKQPIFVAGGAPYASRKPSATR